jgi:hypothetical protein
MIAVDSLALFLNLAAESPGEWSGACPVCDRFLLMVDRGGRPAFACEGGCAADAVLSEIEMRMRVAGGMAAGMGEPRAKANGHDRENGDRGDESESEQAVPLPCLSVADWLARGLDPSDLLLGDLLSTTSRMALIAPTGLGKTMVALALAFAIADGRPFMHWRGHRQTRVLFIDGEMPRELIKERLGDAVRRHGGMPATLFVLSTEDVPDMPPLNTEAGQAYVDNFIERIGGIDFVIFDNIQALTVGDMKEEEGWAQTLPWVKSLTRRRIGQLWVHHTGHDGTRGYGTKTREWQLDTVAIMAELSEDQKPTAADLAFSLKFTKARRRTPHTRADFAEATISLVNDRWESTSTPGAKPARPASPKAEAFRRALGDALATVGQHRPESAGNPSVTMEQWELEAGRLNLIDLDAASKKKKSALMSKYRLELIAARRIACNGEFAWLT